MNQLIIEFKKVYDSVRRGGLYNIVIEFGTPLKLARLIKVSLNETYSGARYARICLTYFLLRML